MLFQHAQLRHCIFGGKGLKATKFDLTEGLFDKFNFIFITLLRNCVLHLSCLLLNLNVIILQWFSMLYYIIDVFNLVDHSII